MPLPNTGAPVPGLPNAAAQPGMRPRFDQPQVFQSYARDLGLDPANLNAGNLWSTMQGLRQQGAPAFNKRRLEAGFGTILGPDFTRLPDVGRNQVWNYLKTGQPASGFGAYAQQQGLEGQPAKPAWGPKVQGQNNPPRGGGYI